MKMKKLAFTTSYIAETLKNRTVTVLLIIFSTLVGGYLSTYVYGMMRMQFGSPDRAFVPVYVITHQSYEGEFSQDDFFAFVPIAMSTDPLANRAANSGVADKAVASFDYADGICGADPVFGRTVCFGWGERYDFTEKQKEDGAAVVCIPRYIADGYCIDTGDTVSVFGQELEVVGVTDDSEYPVVPYTFVFSNAEVIYANYTFVPDRVLSDEETASIGRASGVGVNEQTPLFIVLFVVSTVFCALNTLIAALYIIKRSKRKYRVCKMLGAGNALIAFAMFCELALLSLSGTVAGYFIGSAVYKFIGGTEISGALGIGDAAAVIAVNIVTVCICAAYAVVKCVRAVPCRG